MLLFFVYLFQKMIMKSHIFYLVVLLGFSLISAIQITEECDVTSLKVDMKEQLKPTYKYDSAKTTRFYYKNKTQVKEIEVPLFMGEKYRFIFNTSYLTKDVKIEIYNKPLDSKKRELLYELIPKDGQNIYTFNPVKSRKMYVNYTIPEVENPTMEKDCLLFVLGYEIKILKNA